MHVSTAPQASCTTPATHRTWHRLSRRSARSGYLPHSARISELSVCSCSPLAVAAPAAPPPAPARGDDGGEPPPPPAAAADADCAAPATLLPAAAPAVAPAPAAEADADADAEVLGWRRARRLTRSTASSSRCSWVHIEMSMSCIWSLGTTPCGERKEKRIQVGACGEAPRCHSARQRERPLACTLPKSVHLTTRAGLGATPSRRH